MAAYRRATGRPTATSAPAARTREGGWESLGDVGWLDEDNYLYLGDRLEDMILTGGANVYPAEVEAAMQEHPDVRSVAVIGLPDDDLGNIVHAVVEADPKTPSRGRLCCPSLPSGLLATRFPAHSSTRISLSATKPANSAGAPSEPSGLPRIPKADPRRPFAAHGAAKDATRPTTASSSVPAVIRRKTVSAWVT